MTTTRKGQIVTDEGFHKMLADKLPSAYRLASYDNTHSPATQIKLAAMALDNGYMLESVFDAAHGKRYLCFAYRDPAGRKACWDVLTGASK
jgi:hypothetical protein